MDNNHIILIKGNIDAPLQAIYTLFKLDSPSNKYITENATAGSRAAKVLLSVFKNIDNGNYDAARNLTVFNLLNISPSHIEAGNVLGYADNFLKTIKEFVIIIQHIKCPNNCAISGRMEYNPMVDSKYRYPTEFINAVNATTTNECLPSTKTENQHIILLERRGTTSLFCLLNKF